MKIMLELFDLKNLLIDAAKLGAEAAEKRRSPDSDRMKQREVHRWLKSVGLRPSILKKWEDDNLVHSSRMGSGKNSPLVYSRLEIEAVLGAYRSFDYVNIANENQ